MSVREEDRQKNSCPSRGLGIAAAAIGVGVGAALYYFFNKRQENPNSEGSTSDWSCERQQAFPKSESDGSYTTISEHDTSDTSINTSIESQDYSVVNIESTSGEELAIDENDSQNSERDSDSEMELDTESDSESGSGPDSGSDAVSEFASAFNIVSDGVYLTARTFETGYVVLQNILSSHMPSDSENTEWDITSSSLGVPEGTSRSPMSSFLGRIGDMISPRKQKMEDERMTKIRQQAFRERSWTLEECSICFDVMLRNQEVTTLPCAHNFHTECIMPWLQEKQTCPNCRKVAE